MKTFIGIDLGSTTTKAIVIDEDVELDDGDEADDTFLEEEEGEEDDVSGLIDGDIDTDEEG